MYERHLDGLPGCTASASRAPRPHSSPRAVQRSLGIPRVGAEERDHPGPDGCFGAGAVERGGGLGAVRGT